MKMAYPKCVLFGVLQFKNKSFRRMPHVYGVTALQRQLNLGGEADGGPMEGLASLGYGHICWQGIFTGKRI